MLGDIVAGAGQAGSGLAGSVATLGHVHRFDAGGAIARLAGLLRDGRSDAALTLLHDEVAPFLWAAGGGILETWPPPGDDAGRSWWVASKNCDD